MSKNYYEILEIGIDSSEEEIKKAFRKLAMKYHPDKYSNSSESEKKIVEDKFKEINEANGILSDIDKRKKYDLGLMGNKKRFSGREFSKEKNNDLNSENLEKFRNMNLNLERLKKEGNAKKNQILKNILK